MRPTLLVFAALALGACASQPATVWNKPGAQIDEFRRDRYACVQESRTSWSGGGGGAIGLAIMASAQAHAKDEAQRLYTLCMESKGYEGRPAEPGEEIRR